MADFIFKTEPWEHQRAALEYLYNRDCAALYTAPGTGKTKVMIDLIINRGFKRVLIVCTNKGCEVWQKQFKIHSDLPTFSVLNLSGMSTAGKVSALKSLPKKRNSVGLTVVICNYEGVWREPLAKELLKKSTGIDCVICDESHRIKTPGSKVSRFLTRLSGVVPYRYLVTGTPAAESPMDIYAQYRFLDKNIFGTSFQRFKDRYQNLDVQATLRVGFPILDKTNPYKNLDELQEKMFSCAFLAESTVKLPKQLNIVTSYTIGKKTERLYKELRKEGVLICKQGYLEVSNVLTMSLREQQLVSGYVQIETETKDKKLIRVSEERVEVLQDLLEQFAKGEPIVIFAKYRKDLKNIRKLCQKLGRGYSEISGTENTQEDWDKGKTSIIGVQYSSGSESIDLTRARYCIYYSLTTQLALYEQSKKRIHRPGQTRPVTYYHICAKMSKGKTIDEKILHALKTKQDVVEYLMKINTLPES